MNNSSIINEYLSKYIVEYNNQKINLYELSKIISIGDTFNYAPLNNKILNIFIKKVQSNLKNTSITLSLYGANNQVRIFGTKL